MPDRVAQRVEMRELPREQEAREQPTPDTVLGEEHLAPGARACARGALARGGGPAHERGDAAHEGADPGVEHGEALQRGVDGGVEGDVGGAEEGDGGVDAKVEGACAEGAGEDGEEEGVAFGDQAADEGPVAGAGHFGVVGGLEEHVEGVGGGGGKGCAGGEEEEG